MRTFITLSIFAAACSASGSGSDAGMCGAHALRPQARSRVEAILVGSTVYIYGGDVAPGSTAVPAPRQLVDDFWTYDATCDIWSQLGTAQAAGPIGDYAAAYDSKRNRIIYYGGQKGTTTSPPVIGEVWAYAVATMTWTRLVPGGPNPGTRVGHRMVYDAGRDRLVMFGGDRGTAFSAVLMDAWELSFATSVDGTWKQLMGAGPGPRRDSATAVDPTGTKWVLFGGAIDFMTYQNDVWTFTLATNTWTMVTTGGDLPSARFGTKMDLVLGAGDMGASGPLVLFGGHDPLSLGVLNDSFSLDPATGNFRLILAGDTSTSVGGADLKSPERRERHALVGLPGRIWIYGGRSDCGPMDDAWALATTDMTQWTPVYPAMIDETCPRRAKPGQMCQPPPNDCTNPF